MRALIALAAIGVIGLAAAGCGSGQGKGLPRCATGTGSDGSASSLVIHQDGASFTGVYYNTPPGAGAALRYDITGTVHGDRLDSMWSLGGAAIHVTGTWQPARIVLDNPGGEFSTTVFTARGNCPG